MNFLFDSRLDKDIEPVPLDKLLLHESVLMNESLPEQEKVGHDSWINFIDSGKKLKVLQAQKKKLIKSSQKQGRVVTEQVLVKERRGRD